MIQQALTPITHIIKTLVSWCFIQGVWKRLTIISDVTNFLTDEKYWSLLLSHKYYSIIEEV